MGPKWTASSKIFSWVGARLSSLHIFAWLSIQLRGVLYIPHVSGEAGFAPSIEKCMEDLTTISRRFPKSHVVFRDPVFSINLKLTKSLLDEIAKKDLGLEFSAELHLKMSMMNLLIWLLVRTLRH